MTDNNVPFGAHKGLCQGCDQASLWALMLTPDPLLSNLCLKGPPLAFHAARNPSRPWPVKATRSGFLPHSSPQPPSSFCSRHSSFLLFECTICIFTTEFCLLSVMFPNLSFPHPLCLVNFHSSSNLRHLHSSIISSRETSLTLQHLPARAGFLCCFLFAFSSFELTLYYICLHVPIRLISVSPYWNVTMKPATLFIFDHISCPGVSTVSIWYLPGTKYVEWKLNVCDRYGN